LLAQQAVFLVLQLPGKGSITVFFNVGHGNGGGKACRCGCLLRGKGSYGEGCPNSRGVRCPGVPDLLSQ
jgi:hypothetical protein